MSEHLSIVDSEHSLAWVAAYIFQTVISVYMSMQTGVRYFSVKTGRDARLAALVGCILMFIGGIIWYIPPMTAHILCGDLGALYPSFAHPEEAAYAAVALKVLPRSLSGLMVVAMLAATMSGVAHVMNQASGIVTNDIYTLYIRRNASSRETFLFARVFTVIIGLLAIWFSISLVRTSIFDAMINLMVLLGLPLAIPMVLCLFVRRTHPYSAILAVIVTFICSFIASRLAKAGVIARYELVEQVVLNSSVASAVFLSMVPLWRYAPAEYRQKVDAFFTRMHTPVDFEKEVGQSSDDKQYILIGRTTIFIGALIFLLMLTPNTFGERLQILFVGGIPLGLGILFLGLARRARNARPATADAPPAVLERVAEK